MNNKTVLFFKLSLLLFTCTLNLECARHTGRTAAITLPERGLCAHRGAMDSHPENTIPAFLEAIRLGAHMIEFDLQMTKDSVLVIMHDETVDRTTNGHGAVKDLTLAEIKQLDAGIKKSTHFADVRIPTFEETLAIMPRNTWLNCHLKGDAEAGRKAAELIVKAGRVHQAFLACGEKAAVAARKIDSQLLICNMEDQFRKVPEDYVKSTLRIKAQFLQLVRNNEPNEQLMAQLKQNKVHVNYFYAQKPEELASLYAKGVDFVLVNELSKFMTEARKLNVYPVQPKF